MAEKLKSTVKSNSTSADVIEEFEDEQGNVFNKKTYEGNLNCRHGGLFFCRSQKTGNYIKTVLSDKILVQCLFASRGRATLNLNDMR